MSGNNLLLDSNVVIYLSQGVLRLSDFARPEDVLYTSIVVYMEVLGYNFTSTMEEAKVRNICNVLNLILVDEDIANQVIAYRKIRKIKLPDAIILATAKVHNCKIVTRNVGDFARIDSSIEVVNPFVP